MKEYLASICDLQKVKANKGVIDIKVDAIILIAHDKMPRQFWKLGSVQITFRHLERHFSFKCLSITTHFKYYLLVEITRSVPLK